MADGTSSPISNGNLEALGLGAVGEQLHGAFEGLDDVEIHVFKS